MSRIQSYESLADSYDGERYVGATNTLKESYRRQALRFLLPDSCARALDVACGTGRGLLILTDICDSVIGLDGTAAMLERAQQKVTSGQRHAFLCQADAGKLPFRDGTFEVVTCLNFLHLFRDVSQKIEFIREMGRVLRPGGIAVVEFDNALQGLVLGPLRKYVGRDIGYDWPWTVRRSFPRDVFMIERMAGANLPFVWRVPLLRFLERGTAFWPLRHFANRLLVQAVRR